jgi:magnesium transporter
VITIFRDSGDGVRNSSSPVLPREIIWIDLLNPTKEETTFVELRTKVRVPSIEMLSEIETSSRLAVDHGAVYLSIPAVAEGNTADAYLSPTGFILTNSELVTIRFAPLSTFDAITKQVGQDETIQSSAAVYTTLLEAMVDRGADVLELLGAELNKVSKSVFRADRSRQKQIVCSNNVLRRALTAVVPPATDWPWRVTRCLGSAGSLLSC